MLYKSDGNIWDNLVIEDDKGLFHNFYLMLNGCLGHIVSRDLVHWEPRPVLDFHVPGTWCENGENLTGSVFKWNGLWHYSIGTMGRQGIGYGFWVSEDLDHWELRDREYAVISREHVDVSLADEGEPIESGWMDPCFRIDRDGVIHGYFSANLPVCTHRDTGCVIAHLTSKDTVHWVRQKPVAFPGKKVNRASCPSLFSIGDRWYLTFIGHGSGGMRWHACGRTDTAGTYYMVSDSPDGPFEFTENPLLLGAGCDSQESWAGRAAVLQGIPYIYSHFTKPMAVNSLKKIVQTEDGGLKCVYDSAIEKLAVGEPQKIERAEHTAKTSNWSDLGEWKSEQGVITGEAEVVGTAALIAKNRQDFILSFKAVLETGACFGAALRAKEYPGRNSMAFEIPGMKIPDQRRAVVIRVDAEQRCAEILYLERASREGYGRSQRSIVVGGEARLYDCCRFDAEYGKTVDVKIVARGCYYDLYLDNDLIFSKSMMEAPIGDVELLVERGKARFYDVQITDLSPLATEEI